MNVKRLWRRDLLVDADKIEVARLTAELADADLEKRVAIQDADNLRKQLTQTQRELESERIENGRLLQLVRPYDPGRAGAAPVRTGDVAYLLAEIARHRANAARLDNLLAAAEGRPVPAGSR